MRKKIQILIGMLLLIGIFFATSTAFGQGLTQQNFRRIAKGGFGDSANSYSWSEEWFKNELYVGTVRHHLWSLIQILEQGGLGDLGDLDLGDLLPDGPQNMQMGSDEYAEAMAGRIYRYRCNQWQEVYRSPTFDYEGSGPIPIPDGTYPKAYGYRTLGKFNGYLYACGVGTWVPPMPVSSVVRSPNGDPGTWDDVTGNLASTTNVRGLVQWRDHLYVAVATPGTGPVGAGGSVVYRKSNDETPGVSWEQVSEVGFDNLDNAEINYLQVFNDCLYASTVNYVTGFEVWKTDGTMGPDEKLVWTQVIENGFGDTWCQSGLHMEPFGDYLYVGTAVPIGMVLKNQQSVGSRAIDIIRIDKNDNAELVVGAREASDPISGGPTPRIPLSGLGAGFGNPFNVYSWHMGVYRGCLYLGTFDLLSLLLPALAENPELLDMFLADYDFDDLGFPAWINDSLISGYFTSWILNIMYKSFGGGDIWKTCDGIHWTPVTLNGLGNPKNYGIRRIVPYKNKWGMDQALGIGTANPFTGQTNGGCEVWVSGWVPTSPNCGGGWWYPSW